MERILFNKNNYTNLNLSKIIYIIYKILINIDKNTDFYNELKKNIFVKYNIILNEKKFEIENVEECINLLEEIKKKIEEFDLEYKDIISKIEAKKAYKNFLHGKDNQLKDIKKTILQRSKKSKNSNKRIKV